MPTDALTREVFGNIDPISKAVFYALAAVATAACCFGVYRRARLWRLGRKDTENIQWGRVFTQVILQRSTRRGRIAAGRAHSMLFSGFAVLLIGTGLIAIEHLGATLLGYEKGQAWFHRGVYYAIYEMVLDAFGLLLLAGCCWFIVRRWRGGTSMDHQRTDWIVLGAFVLLGVSGYLIEGVRIIREQTPLPGFSFVGYGVALVFETAGTTPPLASAIHFVLWWVHAVVALTIVAAFPYSRLLHVFAGTLSIATSDRQLGRMIPVSIDEVERTGVFGVGQLQQFTRRQLRQLDACVSCGRCQDACPAYAAGKPLSPRNLVQDLRAHMDTVGSGLGKSAGPSAGESDSSPNAASLHGQVIAAETIWACTTCNACVDLCPLGVDPLQLITDLRRNRIGEGELRGPPAQALQRLQRTGNPWGLPASDRSDWASDLKIPTVQDHPDFEVLYWVGCAAAYDRRIQRVARAVVKLLQAADVKFAVLGPEERCTGEFARRMGDEFVFQELAEANLQTLAQYRVRRIVTHCPHCLNSLKQDYAQFGDKLQVLHHSQLIAELIDQGAIRLDPTQTGHTAARVTYHDPCYLARVNQVVSPPRRLIDLALPGQRIEMPRHGTDTSCCGAGGGRMWFDDDASQRTGSDRVSEALATGAQTVAVSCPFCLTMMQDGVAAQAGDVQVKDIAELLAEALDD